MTTRYVLACAAFSVGVMGNVFATGYSDDILDSSDASVKRLVDGRSLIYVFTQPSTEVSVTFKTAATLERALVVGGGGAGGAVMGGGGGGGGVVAVSINRCPKSANEKWCTQLSADGKTVQLVWGVGLKVFIR